MTNSQNANSKCFSGIVRRLLCTGSLPTYPSDHITEAPNTINFHFPGKESKTEAKPTQLAPSTPGIVARLMGLDTLPDINWVPRQTTLDSILRSRSVNFVDYLPEFDLTQQAHQHRQVRTSVSFREVPTFLHQQNQDCYVLCFEKSLAPKSNEMGVNVEKSKKGCEEMKLKNAYNKKNISERVFENKKKACKGKEKLKSISGEPSSKVKKAVYRKPPAKPMNPKQVPVGSNFTNKKKKQKAAKKVVPAECNLEESRRPRGLNPKAKSSSKLAGDDGHVLGTIKSKAEKTVKTPEIEEYYTKLLCEICRLTEEETTNWVAHEVFKFEDFEEICMEFGQQILELLVNQVVDELVGLQMMKNLGL